MNFFETVRNLGSVCENANCDYSTVPEGEDVKPDHGQLLLEKDPFEIAQGHSQEANRLSKKAHYEGGDHWQPSIVHTYASVAHDKLANDLQATNPHAAAYHRELADSHRRMSKLHDAAAKKP